MKSFVRDVRDAAYWRTAYETLVKQTGRDLNDGLGPDPRVAQPRRVTGQQTGRPRPAAEWAHDFLHATGRAWQCACPDCVASGKFTPQELEALSDRLAADVAKAFRALPPITPRAVRADG